MEKDYEKNYCAVTGNRISKPNTFAKEVITQFEELYLDKEITADDIRQMIESTEDRQGLINELASYFELNRE